MKVKSRKVWWAVIAVIAIIAVTLTILFVQDKPVEPSSEDKGQTQSVAFTEANARYLEDKVNDPDKEQQILAMVPIKRESKQTKEAPALPKGTKLQIKHSTFKELDSLKGSVEGSIKNGKENIGEFVIFLAYVQEEDKWLTDYTKPKE